VRLVTYPRSAKPRASWSLSTRPLLERGATDDAASEFAGVRGVVRLPDGGVDGDSRAHHAYHRPVDPIPGIHVLVVEPVHQPSLGVGRMLWDFLDERTVAEPVDGVVIGRSGQLDPANAGTGGRRCTHAETWAAKRRNGGMNDIDVSVPAD